MTSLVGVGQLVLQRTSLDGGRLIQEDLDKQRARYEALRSAARLAEVNLEGMSARWTDLRRNYEQLSAWIRNMEVKLSTEDANLGRDVAEKKIILEKINVSGKANIFMSSSMQRCIL